MSRDWPYKSGLFQYLLWNPRSTLAYTVCLHALFMLPESNHDQGIVHMPLMAILKSSSGPTVALPSPLPSQPQP